MKLIYKGNGAKSGSTSNTVKTQYFNSGVNGEGANNSNPSFKLASNGFEKNGYTFSKWALGSASGTQYKAGASFSGWNPGVSDDDDSRTFYAKWKKTSSTTTSSSQTTKCTCVCAYWDREINKQYDETTTKFTTDSACRDYCSQKYAGADYDFSCD